MVPLPNDGVTLRNVPWPVGTLVALYPRISDQMLPDMPPTGVPAVEGAYVDGAQTVTFQPGNPDGPYWACAPLTPGQRDYQYVGLNLEPPPPTQIPGPQGPPGIQGPVGPVGPQGAQGPQGTQPQVPTMWVNLASPGGQAINVGANQNMTQRFAAGAAAYTIEGGGTLLQVTNAGIYAVTAWVRGGAGASYCRHAVAFATSAPIAGGGDSQGDKGLADAPNRPASTSAFVRPLTALSAISVVALTDVLPMTGGITIAKVGDYVP